GRGTADRIVDDVDTVDRGLVDGRRGVGAVAGATGRVGEDPAGLVDGDARAGRDAADRAEAGRVTRCRDAVVAGGRRRGVRAMAAVVTRRQILVVRKVRGTHARDEVPGCDHLAVARARRERLTLLADAGEARHLVRVVVAVRAADLAVRERGVLRPVAAVDVAEDDVLAGPTVQAALADTAELVPQPAVVAQVQERVRGAGRGRCVDRDVLGLLDHRDVLQQLELRRLLGGPLSGEAVDDGGGVVNLVGAAHLLERA